MNFTLVVFSLNVKQSRTVIRVCPFFSRRYNRLAREWTQKYAMWECLRLKKTTESNGQRNTFLLVTRGVKISECWGEGTTKQQTLGRESESGGESHYELNPLSCAVLLNPPSERISLENSRKTVKPDKPRGTTTQEVRLVLLLVLLLLSLWFSQCYSSSLFVIVMFCRTRKHWDEVGRLVTHAWSCLSRFTILMKTIVASVRELNTLFHFQTVCDRM